jgi:hypothetical protein
MRLHVMAGCDELLWPLALEPEALSGLIGPNVCVATAFWLSPESGTRYHTFLQEHPGDRRTKVMAMALRDSFGRRVEPLLILPGLLNEIDHADGPHTAPAGRRSQLTVLAEIWGYGYFDELRLHAAALPAAADPDEVWAAPGRFVAPAVGKRLEELSTTIMAEVRPAEITEATIEIAPRNTQFGGMYRNAIAHHVERRLAPRLGEQGLRARSKTFTRTIAEILLDNENMGLTLAFPLRAAQLDAITEMIRRKCL